MSSQHLLNQIKWELNRDLSRWDVDNLDDLYNWERNVIECPSADLERMMGQIPEDDTDLFEIIDDMVKQIVATRRAQILDEEE